MSRKRDTNWSKDEIKVLLDSIMEITRLKANSGKRTNSREVFEFAAKRLGEKGFASRATREKCRTKWKKMKEEFTHARKAREGDNRYKEAPGIQPFYSVMEEFVNGNFDNISPHSTIVRRTSSLAKSHLPAASAVRVSARIAASTTSTENTDTIDYNCDAQSPNSSTSNRQSSSRLSPNSDNNNSNNNTTTTTNTANTNNFTPSIISQGANQTTANNPQPTRTPTANPAIAHCFNQNSTPDCTGSVVELDATHNESAASITTADISYRVSAGYRQITIFGDHDVDIKFRSDCVTINKIVPDLMNGES